MELAAATFDSLARLRQTAPLVVNVTNNVVTNTTANALLALGASPAMTHHPDDAAELAAMAGAVVLNMGTPGEENIKALLAAARAAQAAGVPVVFDPVAAGVTARRREVAKAVLETGPLAAIRGNASEILALAGMDAKAKGADSRHDSLAAADAAAALAARCKCVVCASGAVDVITDGKRRVLLAGGHAMMPKVTGLGCTATAFVAAFAAVVPDRLGATVGAMAVMSAAGYLAGAGAAGPGSFFTRFLDVVYALDAAGIAAGVREAS